MSRKKKEIEETEVSQILRQGGYVRAYEALARQAEREAIKVPKTTVAQRKEILKEAIESVDVEHLTELQGKMTQVIDTITSNEVDLSGGHILTVDEAFALMTELLDQRDVQELLAARKEMVRLAVFLSMDEELRLKGVEDPSNENYSIRVPQAGKRFAREACGPKEATINEEKLKELLGEELWEAACDVEVIPRQIIPRHVEYTLNIERLMKLVEDEPMVLEWISESFEVNGMKTPRFTIRDL